MIAGGVAVFLVLVWLRRRSAKRRRNTGADALTDALGLVKPYKGPAWKIGKRPEL